MKEKMIKLNATGDVKEFVRSAEQCDFDIDLIYQHIFIDAKSFLGVMGLLNKEMKVSYFGENPGFEKILQKYTVA